MGLSTSLVETSRQLFLSCLSLCYAVAFISYYIQIPGLFGPNGVMPAHLWANRAGQKSNYDKFVTDPNMVYLLREAGLTVEESLIFLCLSGVALAILSFSARVSRGCLVYAMMWFFYLSLVSAGQTFLSFQWDILLVEAGFLAIVIAPLNFPNSLTVRIKRHDDLTMLLVRVLLFKLMFMSGVVKLRSFCPTWWNLTALTYHFETQCIPTPLAWFAHSLLPVWVHKLAVVAVYLIEIVFPFYLFSPIKAQRRFAVYSIMFLMVTIVLSGNYNFFNFLTIALCFGSLKDSDYPPFLQSYEHYDPKDTPVTKGGFSIGYWVERLLCWVIDIGVVYWTIRLFNLKWNWSTYEIDSSVNFSQEQFQSFVNIAVVVAMVVVTVVFLWKFAKNLVCSIVYETGAVSKVWSFTQTLTFGVIVGLLVTVSFVPLSELSDRETDHLVPEYASSLFFRLHDLKVSNGYGLFRRMTGVGGRPEVVLEGSHLKEGPWTELHFLYKPGNVSAPPPWVAPHQPRLDWQMWFAALSTPQFTHWFNTLAFRILTGQPEVMALLDEKSNSKFETKPPTYLRAVKYKYFFTKGSNVKNWWRREKEAKLYLEPVDLKSPQLLDHINRFNIKTVTPLKYSDSWPFYRRLLFKMRPDLKSLNIGPDALMWSLLLPILAMKLGKIFTPKYPVKMFYL